MAHTVEQILGDRIRAARLQRGLTLRDVERLSGGALTGVAIGSYERADRTISVTKFLALADLYGVAATDLLPSADDVADRVVPSVAIDLARVAALPVYRREPLAQLARQAGRHPSGPFTLDDDDIRSLARVYGVDPHDLAPLFKSWGIVAQPAAAPHAPTRRRRHADGRTSPAAHAAGGVSRAAVAAAYQSFEQAVAI